MSGKYILILYSTVKIENIVHLMKSLLGIWLRDIRYQSGLLQQQLNKVNDGVLNLL